MTKEFGENGEIDFNEASCIWWGAYVGLFKLQPARPKKDTACRVAFSTFVQSKPQDVHLQKYSKLRINATEFRKWTSKISKKS